MTVLAKGIVATGATGPSGEGLVVSAGLVDVPMGLTGATGTGLAIVRSIVAPPGT